LVTTLNEETPNIQEELLFPPRIYEGKDPITEHQVRTISGEIIWLKQRVLWDKQMVQKR